MAINYDIQAPELDPAYATLQAQARGASAPQSSFAPTGAVWDITQGGTGADTASGARANLGIGTLGTQSAASVSITGGAIDGATIGATTAAAITGTIINATSEFRVAGTKVLGAQGAAVADAAGGAIVDTEARAAINTLLARLRAHGIIAT